MKKLLLASVAVLLLATGMAYAEESDEVLAERCKNGATYWCGILDQRNARHCIQALAPASNKPLTRKQFRTYKELRSIHIPKEDAAQVARDPGVKKGEWGWAWDGEESGNVKCVKADGSVWHPGNLMKYRNNVVVE
jgi:hypothetical protein